MTATWTDSLADFPKHDDDQAVFPVFFPPEVVYNKYYCFKKRIEFEKIFG